MAIPAVHGEEHVKVPIGLGIGRLVFRAFNVVEGVLAAALLVAIVLAACRPRSSRACSPSPRCSGSWSACDLG